MTPRLPIWQMNDMLRSTFMTGRIFMTEGILALPNDIRAEVLTQVRIFDQFTPDNDPFGEHDFGSVMVEGAGKVFWKIDYYDPTMTKGSEDPYDPAKTCQVLTIMLAEEY